MKYIYTLILSLALAQIACLQTTILQSAPPAASPLRSEPPLITGDTPEPPEEPESGTVFVLQDQSPQTAIQDPKCAVVTAIEALHLREEPSEQGTVIGWLRAGQIVTVKTKEPEWWLIETRGENRKTGYSRAAYLKESECE